MRYVPPVEVVLRKIEGVNALARVCGVTHSAVCCWRRSGVIPGRHLARIYALLKARGVTADDLIEGRLEE